MRLKNLKICFRRFTTCFALATVVAPGGLLRANLSIAAETPPAERVERETVQALIGALKDSSADVRRSAALSLGEWGTQAATATESLAELLKDAAADVREAAAATLGKIAGINAD